MKKLISILLGISILFGVLLIPVLAKTTTTSTSDSSNQNLIQLLKQQIEDLKAKIEALTAQINALIQVKSEVKQAAKEVKKTLRLTRHLRIGIRGEDVKLLQEVLATDPSIYPEGLVTGYFGPLTRNAVKRFQKMAGIEQVGVVGPKTTAKINELLEEGAGSSGKVPPGLLIAPGIRKKLGFTPEVPSGQELPPGISKKISTEGEEGEDTTPPVISDLRAIGTTATSTKISWITDEKADSKVWYDTSTPLTISETMPQESSSDLNKNHKLSLFNLNPNTTYYFIVSSTDEAGNCVTSSEESFKTLSAESSESSESSE